MNSLLSQVRSDLSGCDEITAASLVRVGVALAAHVNTLSGLKGSEKQEVIVKTLLAFLAEKKAVALKALPDSEREMSEKSIEAHYLMLETTARSVVPAAIDVAIDAARGLLKLKKHVPSRWMPYFLCGMKSVFAAIKESEALREEMKKIDAAAPPLVKVDDLVVAVVDAPVVVEAAVAAVAEVAAAVVPVVEVAAAVVPVVEAAAVVAPVVEVAVAVEAAVAPVVEVAAAAPLDAPSSPKKRPVSLSAGLVLRETKN